MLYALWPGPGDQVFDFEINLLWLSQLKGQELGARPFAKK
jgi:hypothetical protein